MGPLAAKSYAGQQLVQTQRAVAQGTTLSEQERPEAAERATQEIDYGRRGKGYILGAFRPASGAAFTRPYPGRTITNWVDFLEQVEAWLPSEIGRQMGVLNSCVAHETESKLGSSWSVRNVRLLAGKVQ
jgi:hypothetical protein